MSETTHNTSPFGNIFGNSNPATLSEKQKRIQTLALIGIAISMMLLVCIPAPWKWVAGTIQTCFLCGVTFVGWNSKRNSLLPFILSIVAAIMMIALGISGTFKV